MTDLNRFMAECQADPELAGLSYGEIQKREILGARSRGELPATEVIDGPLGPISLYETVASDDVAWMLDAFCKDLPKEARHELFPEDGRGVDEARRKYCGQCAVQTECLNYAVRNRIDHGVWGGKSERERRRIARIKLI